MIGFFVHYGPSPSRLLQVAMEVMRLCHQRWLMCIANIVGVNMVELKETLRYTFTQLLARLLKVVMSPEMKRLCRWRCRAKLMSVYIYRYMVEFKEINLE